MINEIEGTLFLEKVDSSVGESIRTSFKIRGRHQDFFACWVKLSDLSGDILKRLGVLESPKPYACMLGFTEFSDQVAYLLKKRKKNRKTLGIYDEKEVLGLPWD